MWSYVKICELDQLPPGKGKLVRFAGRQIQVYNREGRVVASLEEPTGSSGLHPSPADGPSCGRASASFDVEQQDSLARMRAAGPLRVRVDEESVYVAIRQGQPVEASPLPY